MNLLSNAVKYNHADGTVSVSAELIDDSRLKLSITDSGVGLAEADLEKIFEPFERVYTDVGNVEGTGIGLVITKSLVELMGGSIGVESYKYVGSTFWIELNLAKDGDKEVAPEEFSETADAPEVALKGMKILYIEDEPANLRLVEQFVDRLSDATLLTAGNGPLGIDIARKEKPDVILLDINLPGMDGYQVAEQLFGFSETESIPIIGLSANALQDQVDKALKLGFVDYITKPIKLEKLMQTLEKVLDQGEQTQH